MRRLLSVTSSFVGGMVGAVIFLGIVAAKPAQQKTNVPQAGIFRRVSADTISARHIDVVDDDGNAVIRLYGSGKLGPSVWVGNDSTGTARLGPDGVFVANTDSTVATSLSPHGIVATNRTSMASLTVSRSGEGAFVIVQPNGRQFPSATVGIFDGKVGVDVQDASGQTRFIAGQTSLVTKSSGVKEDTPVGSLTVFDEVGNVVWRVPR